MDVNTIIAVRVTHERIFKAAIKSSHNNALGE